MPIFQSRPLVASLSLFLATSLGLASCQGEKGKGDKVSTTSASGGKDTPAAAAIDLDSKDILARTETADSVQVKHVLIGWKDTSQNTDPRAKARTNAEAVTLAKDVFAKLVANPDAIDELVKQHSEDPGSLSGSPYEVNPDVQFVPEFKKLALRLKEKETGIVKTSYGYHVMTRVPPPPLDPLESADILARPAEPGPISVRHILIGWKDTPAAKRRPPDPRAVGRDKAAADKLASDVLARARANEDMAKLMKEFSEDPGSKDTGKEYEVTPGAALVPPFKALSLRLKAGEVGLVKTDFGWHIIKRTPPDSLESADILSRPPETEKAKVKHILLGWSELNAGDDRGKKRTRKELETLVTKTLAALKKGEKIEPLMKKLSEDPGSAESGESYDVSPTASLVPPFKNLSLRLKVGEVGAVKTNFGIHIIQRTE